MKVLIIHDFGHRIGGAETYVLELIEDLRKKVDLYFLFNSSGNIKGRENEIIYKSNESNIVKKFWIRHGFDFKFYIFFKKILKKINPDIIHLNNINLHYLPILKAIKGYPVIQTIHDYGIVCPKGWAIDKKGKICTIGPSIKCLITGCIPLNRMFKFPSLKIKENLIRKRVDLLIAPSQHLKNILKNKGFKKVTLLNYFIDLEKWKKVKKSYESDRKIILYLGVLTRAKGVNILLDAIKRLPEKYKSEIILQIVGSGPYERELKEMVNKLNLSSIVHFLGPKYDTETKRKLYKNAYITVVPSVYLEQFGIVGLESMACSTPVIGSNIGGIPEWLKDKKTGLLFEPGNSEDLKNKIIHLLDNPKLARKYGENGRKLVEKKFSKKDHIKKLIKIYEEVYRRRWKTK
jgi:glycosyltransferase involved in cell wall biosynthesis